MAQGGEAGHWYDPVDCRQVGKVQGAKGKWVTPDARHARRDRLLSGITTITKEWANGMLARWSQKTALEALLKILQDEFSLDLGEYEPSILIQRAIEEGPRLVASETAEQGKAIHAAVDRYFRGDRVDGDMVPWVQTAVAAVESLGISPLMCRAEIDAIDPLGEYGCRGDIVCKEPPVYIDIKTRDFTADDVAEAIEKRAKGAASLGKLTPYQTEPLQVVGNMDAHFGMMDEDALGYCLYLSRTDPSIYYLHQFKRSELEQARLLLRACCVLFNAPRGLGVHGD